MSEKSACHELREQIWLLDAQFEIREPREPKDSNPVNAVQRLRQCEAPYLREIYLTGHITRPSLPRHWEPSRPVEIPAEILESLGTDSAKTAPKIPSELLHELLWPKRKRGRPRNVALHALVESQRCSERHSRRLIASGKQRKRVRERSSLTEDWALQQREKRAKLVQALEQELSINELAYWLNLSYHWEAYTKALKNGDDDLVDRLLSAEPNSWARQLAERMAAEKGSLAALGFVRQSLGLRPSVSVSRSTMYRRFPRLHTSCKTLREYDPSQAVNALNRSKPRRPVREENENAWTIQTTFSPENLRAVY